MVIWLVVLPMRRSASAVLALLDDHAQAVVAHLELGLPALLVGDDVGEIHLGERLEGQLGRVLVGGVGDRA